MTEARLGKINSITAVVLAKNEENDLEECLKSLSWADEIIVIDDHSTDKTVKIAKKYTNKVFGRSLNKDFAKQRNFGLEKASSDWVLFIDPDEKVNKKLAVEIQETIKRNTFEAFYFKRRDFFLGRWLNFGETSSVRLLRLAKKDAGEWVRPVHEVWKVEKKSGELIEPLSHYSHPNLEEFFEKINTNSSIDAEHYFKEGKRFSLFEMLFFPPAKFFKNYILALGFLDGLPGLVMAVMMSLNSFLIRAKLWELWKSKKGRG